MSVFKAYDIRGIYGAEIDETLAEKIGASFVKLIGGGPIVVGRDMRSCAPSIAAAVIKGARAQGADVIDIGLASTPMTYFATGKLEVAGSVQVTASHNPAKYIGMKFCRRGCVPVSGDTGIKQMEADCKGPIPAPVAKTGALSTRDVMKDYVEHVSKWVDRPIRLKTVIDAGNGMGGLEMPGILDRLKIDCDRLFFELDGTFPNHEANPLKIENLRDAAKRVVQNRADIGLAFDGDADRCAFIDERGERVANDVMTAIIAREVLKKHPGSHVVYDLRSSRIVAEEVRRAGGVPVKERVGHSFIKATMRAKDACFGGELSGHYYFKENYTADSGAIAMMIVLSIMERDRVKLSDLAKPLLRYPNTGEVNFEVEDKDGVIAELKRMSTGAQISDLDGVTVEYPNYWFNVRKSNTEPLLRLTLEADDQKTLDEVYGRLLKLLGHPSDH